MDEGVGAAIGWMHSVAMRCGAIGCENAAVFFCRPVDRVQESDILVPGCLLFLLRVQQL